MLIHVDNFSIYGGTTAKMLDGRYSAGCTDGALINDPDGVSSGKVFTLGTLRRPMQTPANRIGMAARFWPVDLPFNDTQRTRLAMWNDASNNRMVWMILDTTGSITLQVRDFATGNVFDVKTTTGPVMSANAWTQLEAFFDASAATFELRVEGVTKMTANAGDFGAYLWGGVSVYQCAIEGAVGGGGGAVTVHVKDVFWWDNNGARNTSFLGPCIVAELDPDADVTLGGWVPSTGAVAWDILNNDPPAGNTPNISADNTPPAPVQVTQTNLPPDITSVKGIMTIVRAAKVDGGDGQMQVSMVSGASFSNGVDRPITVAQTYWEDVHEVDPATGSAWLPVAVDASKLQIDRTV